MPVGGGGRGEKVGQTIIKTPGAVIREMPPYLISTPVSERQSVSLEKDRGTC